MLLRVNQSTEIFKVWKTENSSESVVRMWGNRDKDNGRINQRKINYIDNNYLVSLIRTLAHYQFRTHILLLTLMKEKKKHKTKPMMPKASQWIQKIVFSVSQGLTPWDYIISKYYFFILKVFTNFLWQVSKLFSNMDFHA